MYLDVDYNFAPPKQKPIRYVTKHCGHCNGSTRVFMTGEQAIRYERGEEYVDRIFSHISKDKVEVLISGIHPECWDELFGRECDQED